MPGYPDPLTAHTTVLSPALYLCTTEHAVLVKIPTTMFIAGKKERIGNYSLFLPSDAEITQAYSFILVYIC